MLETVVILSARKENGEIPIPLIKIDNNFSILDHSIEILKEYNIPNIILVVGYKRELFEKYNDVATVVYNKDYENTSSMYSLALASPYIKDDFLIIESDTIFEKEIINELIRTSKKNCLSLAQESGSKDEAWVETDNGIIVDISKDIHQLKSIDGEMIGVSKISYDTFRKMLNIWDGCRNKKIRYEYIFLNATLTHERQYTLFRNLIWHEADTPESFKFYTDHIYPKLIRKENTFNKENIVELLKNIFGNDMDNQADIKLSKMGGMTNKNFRVATQQGEFVLRIPGVGTEKFIVRESEAINSVISHEIGISPEIVYFDKANGIKLSQYIANSETLNFSSIQNSETLSQIAKILKKLHSSSIRFHNDFNVFKEINVYKSIIDTKQIDYYSDFKTIDDECLIELENRLNTIGIHLVACHNDLVSENFLKTADGNIFIIDWEYSGMNDPMWDIAALFLESDFTEGSKEFFFKEYQIDEAGRAKIPIYQILMDYLWALWAIIKTSEGDDYDKYGKMRIRRAVELYKVIKNHK